jgi:protein-L-isoaspartate(D-aspartate) O-methyltransferase
VEQDLAARAATNLRHFHNVEVRAESATESRIPKSDLIYVSAGATHPPPAWLEALSIGGRLVLPLTPNEGLGVMLQIVRKSDTAFAASALGRVAFIPCIGARDDAASASLSAALERQSLEDVRSLHRGTPPDETAWCAGAGWWLSAAAPSDA